MSPFSVEKHPLIRAVRRSLERDVHQGLGPGVIFKKGVRYLREVATAPLYLRDVDEVGSGVRTLGRPRIDNLGFISIGHGCLFRSINVPVELATGPGGRLTIGDECFINYGTSLGALERITVGDRCRIGPYCMLVDSEFHDLYERAKRPPPRPVTLEDDVWLGAKVNVMPGVTIGRGAVVGTGAVVTRDVEPFTVVAGVPAKKIRDLDRDKFVSHQD